MTLRVEKHLLVEDGFGLSGTVVLHLELSMITVAKNIDPLLQMI